MKLLIGCPVCSSKEIQYCYTGKDILYRVVKKKFPIFLCAQCNALFLNPFPSTQETMKYYPHTYYAYDIAASKGFFEKIKEIIITSSFEPKKKITLIDQLLIRLFKNKFSGIPLYKKGGGIFLDIGCGNGSNLALLNTYGWKTQGIELDKKAVLFAKKKGLAVTRSSFEKARFKHKFDCIRMWHVFEHLTNPHHTFVKMKKILKNDGEILLAVPNTNSFAQQLFRSNWYSLDVPRHIINYSVTTLQYLCQKNNMKITKIQYASAASYVGGISHILRRYFGYNGNLVNSLFLVFLFAPLDYISDLLAKGDTIFLVIKKV